MTDVEGLLRAADPAAAVSQRPLDVRAERELRDLLQTRRPPGAPRAPAGAVRPRRLVPAGIALGIALVLLGALFLRPGGPWSPRTDTGYAIAVLGARSGASGGGGAYSLTSVLDSMPSVLHRGGWRGSRLVVQGRFVSWSRGETLAFKTGNYQGNSPERTVPWDYAHAQRREVILRLRVDAVIDRAPGTTAPRPGSTLPITLQVEGSKNAARVAQGLIDLGEVVPFLGGGVDGPWQRTLPTALQDPPVLLASVDSHGALRWPLLHSTDMGGEQTALKVDAHTVADLRDAAQHPRTGPVR